MPNRYKIRKQVTKNPFAAIAVLILVAIIMYVLISMIAAMYKDTNGMACTGLFGVKERCISTFYTEISIFLLNPVIVYAALFTASLWAYSILTARRRSKKNRLRAEKRN